MIDAAEHSFDDLTGIAALEAEMRDRLKAKDAEIESLRDRLSFAEFEWHRATDGMKERDAQIEGLRSQLETMATDRDALRKSWDEECAENETLHNQLESETECASQWFDECAKQASKAFKLSQQLANAHDACLKLCGNHSFATGHGDTVADIIGEIDGQMAKRTEQLASASRALEEIKAQMTTEERDEAWEGNPPGGDFEGAYDALIKIARVALSDEVGKS